MHEAGKQVLALAFDPCVCCMQNAAGEFVLQLRKQAAVNSFQPLILRGPRSFQPQPDSTNTVSLCYENPCPIFDFGRRCQVCMCTWLQGGCLHAQHVTTRSSLSTLAFHTQLQFSILHLRAAERVEAQLQEAAL